MLTAETPRRAGSDRLLVAGFGLASFLGAALLFLIQPMITKMALPELGGSPSVWITANLFFQAVLLAGYSYAHVSTTRLGLRRQPLLQVVLLLAPLAVLPIGLPSWRPPASGFPAGWLLGLLAISVGLPFLALSTASPVLQRWFSALGHEKSADPYFLYATSNAGSLVGLLAYPLVVEPLSTIRTQTLMWAAGYLLFVAVAAAAALTVRRRLPFATEVSGQHAPPPAALPARPQLRWLVYAFVPSSLMLGVVNYLTGETGSFPLLWVIPLAAYLLTFILAFGRRSPAWTRVGERVAPFAVVAALLAMAAAQVTPLWLVTTIHTGVLLSVGVLCHGRLAESRPPVDHLTRFYLLVSVGGVLGGVFNSLVAPAIFDNLWEYPLVMTAALLLRPSRNGRPRLAEVAGLAGLLVLTAAAPPLVEPFVHGRPGFLLSLGVPAVAAALLLRNPIVFAAFAVALQAISTPLPTDAVHQERTFFGIHRVVDQGSRVALYNGSTLHGVEAKDRPGEPVGYYDLGGPVGDLVARVPARWGLIGLGTGSLAGYGTAGSHLTYFEIDQAVADIALDPQFFTFVSSSPANVDVEIGDGRLLVERSGERFDMILLDAFSGASVPVHLLTTGAFEAYRDHLAEGGIVALHISNRYLDLRPVVAASAAAVGWSAAVRVATTESPEAGQVTTTWAVAGPSGELEDLLATGRWEPVTADEGFRPWTDAYSTVLSVLK